MTGDPVAWQMIERGWSVFDADGNQIGKVDQVTGDLKDDIFNGITVGDGGTVLTRARYVASEHVTAIRQGAIVLDLHAEDVAGLEPYVAPVSEPLAALLPETEEPTPPPEGRTPIDRLFRRRP
jgi:hypothetical protein